MTDKLNPYTGNLAEIKKELASKFTSVLKERMIEQGIDEILIRAWIPSFNDGDVCEYTYDVTDKPAFVMDHDPEDWQGITKMPEEEALDEMIEACNKYHDQIEWKNGKRVFKTEEARTRYEFFHELRCAQEIIEMVCDANTDTYFALIDGEIKMTTEEYDCEY